MSVLDNDFSILINVQPLCSGLEHVNYVYDGDRFSGQRHVSERDV